MNADELYHLITEKKENHQKRTGNEPSIVHIWDGYIDAFDALYMKLRSVGYAYKDDESYYIDGMVVVITSSVGEDVVDVL